MFGDLSAKKSGDWPAAFLAVAGGILRFPRVWHRRLQSPTVEEISYGIDGYRETYGTRALTAINAHIDVEHTENGQTFRYYFLVAIRDELLANTAAIRKAQVLSPRMDV